MGVSLAICTNLTCMLERKGILNWVLVNLLFFLCAKNWKDTYCYVFFDNYFTSPTLLVKLLEMGIYATGTVRANRKHMPILKQDKEMSRGEHDWFSANHLSVIKWMDNKSVILLSNYLNPKEMQQMIAGQKDQKIKSK